VENFSAMSMETVSTRLGVTVANAKTDSKVTVLLDSVRTLMSACSESTAVLRTPLVITPLADFSATATSVGKAMVRKNVETFTSVSQKLTIVMSMLTA